MLVSRLSETGSKCTHYMYVCTCVCEGEGRWEGRFVYVCVSRSEENLYVLLAFFIITMDLYFEERL